MEIPLELRGKEVKKFEDTVKWYTLDIEPPFSSVFGVSFRTAPMLEVFNLNRDLYSLYAQPFQPEMIEKYFEIGLEKLSETSWGDEFIDLTVLNDETMGILVDIDSIELSNHTVYHFEPKTLSDFIDCCVNSNIEMRWRNE